MRPLDLDDLAVLQAELEVLDERDLIAELAPDTVVRALDASRPRPARSAQPVLDEPDTGPATQPPARALPAVPSPVDRPARRRGPLPPVEPARTPVEAPVAVDSARVVPVPAPTGSTPAVAVGVARPVAGRPPVPGMTVVRVLPAIAAASPTQTTTAGRRARHAAPDPSPVIRGLVAWATDEGAR